MARKKSKAKKKEDKKKKTKGTKPKVINGNKSRTRRIPKVVGTRARTSRKEDQNIIIEEVVKERRKKQPKTFAQRRAEQFAKTGVADLSQLRQQRQIASGILGYQTQSSDPLTLRGGAGRYNQDGGIAGFSNISARYSGGNLVSGEQQRATRRVAPVGATIPTGETITPPPTSSVKRKSNKKKVKIDEETASQREQERLRLEDLENKRYREAEALKKEALKVSKKKARERFKREEQFSQFGEDEELITRSTFIETNPTQIEPRLNLLRSRRRQSPKRDPRLGLFRGRGQQSSDSSDSDSSGGSSGRGGRGVRIQPNKASNIVATIQEVEEPVFFDDAKSSEGSTIPEFDRFDVSSGDTTLTDPAQDRYAFISDTSSDFERSVPSEGTIPEEPNVERPTFFSERQPTQEEEERERKIFFTERPSAPAPEEEKPKEATGGLLKRDRFAPPISSIRGGPSGLPDTPLEKRTIGSRESAFSSLQPPQPSQDPARRDDQPSKELTEKQVNKPVSSGRGRGRPADSRSFNDLQGEITTLEGQVDTLKTRLDAIVSRGGRPFRKGKLNPRNDKEENLTEVGSYVEEWIAMVNDDNERRGNPQLSEQDEADLRQTAEDIMSNRLRLNRLRALRGARKKKKKK